MNESLTLRAAHFESQPVPDATESLSNLAYNNILDMMLSGHLQAGAVLGERQLAAQLSISRTPLREALARLENESLVTRQHGRTPIVADVNVDTYIHLLDMRRVLEIETAERATGRLSPENSRRMRDAIDALLTAGAPTAAQHWAVDELIHGTIADTAGNPLIASNIRDLRRRTHIFNMARIPHRLSPGAAEHLALIAAVEGNDPQKSRQLMAAHLDNVRNAIIDHILGTKRL